MKRMLTIMLSIFLLLNLVACGSNDDNNVSDGEDIKTADKVKDEPELDFSELVLIENDECKLTITEIKGKASRGYDLKALIENKTSDKNLMFSVISASVDGVAIDPLFATEIAAGKKANKDISFRVSGLDNDVELKWTDIMMQVRISNADEWSEDPIVEDFYHIYPFGEDNLSYYRRENSEKDIIVCDNDYIKIAIIGTEPDDTFGYSLKVYFENKTDTEAMYSVDEASINGFMIDPFFSTTVLPNTCEFNEITWFSSSLEENNIESVENIEFKMRAHDFNDWFSEPYFEDVVQLDILSNE